MSDNEITFMLNTLTLIAVPCILFMLHIYFKEDERELAYLESEYGSIIDRYLFLRDEIESVKRQIPAV